MRKIRNQFSSIRFDQLCNFINYTQNLKKNICRPNHVPNI